MSRRRWRALIVPAAVVAAAVAAGPAQANLSGVSLNADGTVAVDPDTGFPQWYMDNTGTKLKACVDNDNCLGGNPLPDPTLPASVVTGNLADENFYAVARASVTLPNGGRIRYRAVLEAAFANDAVVDGDQVVFTRVQVTGSKIPLSTYPAGTVLTFAHPYGTMTAPVRSDGTLSRSRTESNIGTVADFTPPVTETTTGFGPSFLRWTATAPAAPAGFLGDGVTLHTITGGDGGFNSFVAKRGTTTLASTNLFEVAGQCVGPC
jgi:hypothetical protein